jgi:hypothetical protein
MEVSEIAEDQGLIDFMKEFHRRVIANDLDFIEKSMTNSQYVSIIGSDPDEWWIGKIAVETKHRQNQEMGKQEMKDYEATAYSIGDVGWVVLRHRFRNDGGPWASFRETVVLTKESGSWKIAHAHTSIGRPNSEALGMRLTTQIDRIEKIVQEERPEVKSSMLFLARCFFLFLPQLARVA